MKPRIEYLPAKKLVGLPRRMSLAADTTRTLWRDFMLHQRSASARVGPELISLQLYPALYFEPFNPHTEFEKWAAVEASGVGLVPAGLQLLEVPEGLYAVFLHRGGPSTGPQTFEYIFRTWLPGSGYVLADRPHFEVLGPSYQHGDPASEEEIWIPVQPKPAQPA